MRHDERLKALAETCLLLETLRRGHLMTQLADQIAGSRVGYPTGHAGAGGGEDPMLNRAMAPDQAAADLHHVDEMLLDIRTRARKVDDIRKRYMQPARVLTGGEQLTKSDAGCEVMAKVGSWEPVAHITGEDSAITVNGVVVYLLPEPKRRVVRLGSWAYAFARTHLRLPLEHEAERHAQGLKVRVKAS